MESKRLGTGDNNGYFAAVDSRQQWRLNGWGVEMRLRTSRLSTGDDNGDLAAVDWRRQWRLSGCGLEMTMET